MVTGIYSRRASPDSSPDTNKNHHAKQAGDLFPFCLTQSLLLLTSRVLDNPFTLLFSSQPRLKNKTYYLLRSTTLEVQDRGGGAQPV